MKLYKRPLKSLADLKRERVLLEYMSRESSSEDLFSFEAIRGPKKKKKKQPTEGSGAVSATSGLMDLASGWPGSGQGASAMSLLTSGSPALSIAPKFLPKKKIAGFVWEILGGYLKWRAVEAGIWGVKKLLKSAKEKNKKRHIRR